MLVVVWDGEKEVCCCCCTSTSPSHGNPSYDVGTDRIRASGAVCMLLLLLVLGERCGACYPRRSRYESKGDERGRE